MTHEQWAAAQALFDELCDLPAARRERRLAAAADEDAELAGAVRRMLAGDARDAGLLDRGPAGGAESLLIELAAAPEAGGIPADPGSAAPAEEESGLAPGERLGPWSLVERLGRGGMGEVWVADRSDGAFTQRVAVKLLKRGMDSDQIVARFRRERDILARLSHPGIARLLDAGTAPDGRPYLVMEYVEGRSLTDHCERLRLGVEGRLRLLLAVCDAVDYAHRSLVVHRDLKPSNILVTAEGVVKLLDFGIAKLLEETGTEATRTEMRLLTPSHAAPEQILGAPVTTATDVYGLGVVLYELLTGRLPHRRHAASAAGLTSELERETVERPSAAVLRLPAGALDDDVRRRRARSLRGDLDTIAMKALRRDPERRYAGAAALADDLRRHLSGRPVAARPDTVGYRARKFVGRHRVGVAASVLAALSLVGALVVALWQAQRAERRFQQVRTLANAFVFDVHDRIEPLPGSTEARRAIVETAITYLESLRADAGGDPELARELATAYEKIATVQGHPLRSNLGDMAGADRSFGRASDLLAPLAARGDRAARLRLASVDLNRSSVARARGDETWSERLEDALEHAEALVEEAPTDREALSLAGDAHAEAARAATDLLDLPRAARSAERAMELARRLVELEPTSDEYRVNLSTAYNALGATRLTTGLLEEAAELFRRSIDVREQLVREDPENGEYRRNLLIGYGNLGDVLGYRPGENLGDVAGAAAAYARAIELAEGARHADPSDRRAVFDLSSGLLRLGSVLLDEPSRAAEALAHLEEAERLNASLAAEEPESDRYGYVAVVIHRRIGEALRALGRDAEAARRLETARSTASSFFDGPYGLTARQQLVLATIALAGLRARAGDPGTVDLADAAAAQMAEQPLGAVEATAHADLGRVYLQLADRASEEARSARLRAALVHLEAGAERLRAAPIPAALEPRRAAELAALERDLTTIRRALSAADPVTP